MDTRSKGFTLIELLVVISIIGILAGIVLVSLGGARASARDGRRQANIQAIGTAMELYYNDNTQYIQKTTAPTTELPSLNPTPKDPSTNADYSWVNNTSSGTNTNQSYCEYALLEKASQTAGNKLYFVVDPRGPRPLDQPSAPATTPCN